MTQIFSFIVLGHYFDFCSLLNIYNFIFGFPMAMEPVPSDRSRSLVSFGLVLTSVGPLAAELWPNLCPKFRQLSQTCWGISCARVASVFRPSGKHIATIFVIWSNLQYANVLFVKRQNYENARWSRIFSHTSYPNWIAYVHNWITYLFGWLPSIWADDGSNPSDGSYWYISYGKIFIIGGTFIEVPNRSYSLFRQKRFPRNVVSISST